MWNLQIYANSDLPLAKEIRDGVTWQQMKLFIELPEEETGFYLMRLEVVLHLADFDHVRNSICLRLTKWFVASVNKYCHFLFPPHSFMRDTISSFSIVCSCLIQGFTTCLYSDIFQTQLMGTDWHEELYVVILKTILRFQQRHPWKCNLLCIVIQNRVIFSMDVNEFSEFSYCSDLVLL